MKSIIKINLLAVAVVFCFAACGSNNSSSAPKTDSSTVLTDSSINPTNGMATGTTNNANVAPPATSTTNSDTNSKKTDSTTMKKP